MIENMSDALSSNIHHRETHKMSDFKSQLEGESSFDGAANSVDTTQASEDQCLPSSSEWTSALTSNIDDLLNSLNSGRGESNESPRDSEGASPE
jgi:hypothetical protein